MLHFDKVRQLVVDFAKTYQSPTKKRVWFVRDVFGKVTLYVETNAAMN